MPDLSRRLHFADGLRGLAALYVVFFHEVLSDVAPGEFSPVGRFIRLLLSYGHFSVVVFIVLSGFSLMLPVARSGGTELVGGFGKYVYRRMRRILPPYYGALALSLALVAAYNVIAARGGGQRIEGIFEPGTILSHVFLVHNLRLDWAYRINAPMWSVATEWQIYFVFALVLLPSWRKLGIVPTVLFAWAIGLAPYLFLPSNENFFWACPWFLGSFAMGTSAALIGFSPRFEGSFWRERVPWGWLALAAAAATVVLIRANGDVSTALPLMDVLVSVFAFCLILACSCAKPTSLPVRILGSKPMVLLGGFSYSLYLLQHPILKLVEKGFAQLPLGPDANLFMQIAIATPVTLALSWLFAEFFEKPFTSGGILLPAIRRRPAKTGRPQERRFATLSGSMATNGFIGEPEPIPGSGRR